MRIARILLCTRSTFDRVLPDFSRVKRETGSGKETDRGGAYRSFCRNARFADQNSRKKAKERRRKENEKKDSGTPANADPYPPHPCGCGSRLARRARLSAFHRGSHPREIFHPKGSASGQASWDVVCTGVTRLRLSQSRDAPPTPVIMPGG